MSRKTVTYHSKPVGHDALKRAIRLLGNRYRFAKAVGASYNNVQHWEKLDRRFAVPADWCRAVEAATGGVITRVDLRPDLYVGMAVVKPVAETEQQ